MSNKTRDMLRRKQDNKCFYCLVILLKATKYRLKHTWQFPTVETLDHVIPKIIVPKYINEWMWDNQFNHTVLSCFQCNQNKDRKIPKEWDRMIGPYEYSEKYGWVDTGIIPDVLELNLTMGNVTW